MPRSREQERIKAQVYRRKYPIKMAEQKRRYHERLKRSVMDAYGSMCSCGQSDIDVLNIDHVNNDGAEHRRLVGCGGGGRLYNWLKANHYPPGFQVLCANCNLKKEVVRRREESLAKLSRISS